MAYDANRAETVVTGGQFPSLSTDAWHFAPTNWVQDGTNPNDYGDFRALAEDLANTKMVAFGGDDGFGVLNNNTWIRSALGVWSQPTPTGSPSARSGGGFAYCPALGMPVHFGGIAAGVTYPTDTRAFDGTNWVNLAPAGNPPGRAATAMCTFGTGVLLFGGWINPGPATYFNDAWFFDGTNWADITPGASPDARNQHGLAYYETVNKAILFGGANDSDPTLDDTWSLDLGTGLWTQEAPIASPAGRFGAPLSWEPTLEGVLLFAGDTGGISGEQQDTWLFQYSAPPLVASLNHAFGLGR